MKGFTGFIRPESNYYRLPNDWFNIWQQARQTLSRGKQPVRILSPLKVTEYVIKHTWGWQNYDAPIRLSRSDLRQGRRVSKIKRLDLGTGLGSEASLSRGIDISLSLGMLEQNESNNDPSRQERYYLPRISPSQEKEIAAFGPEPFTGFGNPRQNYFVVPKTWTDLSADISSEVLILSIEYFFRHTWGWQTRDGEIRWLNLDEVAKGRCYRSPRRQGERYDRGIGYTTRQVRQSLEEGVQRRLLVWRHRDGFKGKEYALRMEWMEGIGPDGYYNPDEQDEINSTSPINVWPSQDTPGKRDGDENVGDKEKGVGDKEQSVEGREKVVGGTEESVGDKEKGVGRTYRNTFFKDTQSKTLLQNTCKTTSTTHRPGEDCVVGDNSKKELSIFFQPEPEDGNPSIIELTFNEAARVILKEHGEWYWSEADLVNPQQPEAFGTQEIAAQTALDRCLLEDDQAIMYDGESYRVLSLVEITRFMIANKALTRPVVYYDLWQFLDLPPPAGVSYKSDNRRVKLQQFQVQAEAWGDPDLIVALEQANISADTGRDLIGRYGEVQVGGWLRALRANSNGIRSLASVLIANLEKGLAPPGGPMPVVDRCAVSINSEVVLVRVAGLLGGLATELQNLAQRQPDPRLSDLADIFRQAQEIIHA